MRCHAPMFSIADSFALVQIRSTARIVVDAGGSFSTARAFESSVAGIARRQTSGLGCDTSAAQHPPFNSLRTWQREERFLSEGRCVANVVDGKVTLYGRRAGTGR